MGLYQKSKRIPDVEQRLRWITCTHLENIFSGLFPLVQVCPFGSSINGCGRSGSDLDMVLSFDPITGQLPATQSSLVLQAKAANLNQRLQTQRHMQVMAEVLQNMGTGFVGVQKILQARVPIIKFRQEFTGMECDLSLNSQVYGCIHIFFLFSFSLSSSRFFFDISAVQVKVFFKPVRICFDLSQRTIFSQTLRIQIKDIVVESKMANSSERYSR